MTAPPVPDTAHLPAWTPRARPVPVDRLLVTYRHDTDRWWAVVDVTGPGGQPEQFQAFGPACLVSDPAADGLLVVQFATVDEMHLFRHVPLDAWDAWPYVPQPLNGRRAS